MSPERDDFVGPLEKPSVWTTLKGIAKGLRVEGIGHVMWAVHDVHGQLRMLKVPAYYVPRCRSRLLSTTSLLQTYVGETIHIDAAKLVLSGIEGDRTRGAVQAFVDSNNNLPTLTAYQYGGLSSGTEALSATISLVNDNNSNLTEAEKELLRWHYRLGHLSFHKVKFLFRTGVLARSAGARRLHTAACKSSHTLKCAACLYGKQTRRPVPGKRSSVVRDVQGALKKDDLVPGQRVAVDYFVCSTKGRLFTSRGKTPPKEMYDGGCIFVDHASGYIWIEFQPHLNSHETLRAKEAFELHCRDFGVVPQMYQADQGPAFTSAAFQDKLSAFEQVIRFAGASGHHQNGTAERAISTIMSLARTMMLHAAVHWPDMADPELWPMACRHAVFLYNHVPRPETGLAPIDIFSCTRWEQSKFHDIHVWGAPCYLLDKQLADGSGIKVPRWKPRSTRCVYMGMSPDHACTVPLVLNPETGVISAAFNVVIDDWFATV